jgi:dTDP-4-dehydrorhamnose 3,5-epimerase
MRRLETDIPDVVLLASDRHCDERGFLAEIYNQELLAAEGIAHRFVQDNISVSPSAWTLRGLHFQAPPHAQAKLVRVLRGAAFTVGVDLRRSSPTFGRHVGTVLSAENWYQLFLPQGFAHGVLTLEADTEILMKLDARFAPEHASGLAWNDPDLAIPWPRPDRPPLISDRDRAQPRWRNLPILFP